MEQNKKDIISILSQIFSSNGEDNKESWSDLLCSLISGDDENIKKGITFLKQNLIIKEKVELTLDVIDFLINYGSKEIIEQIAHKDFLNCILVLLKNKSKSSVEVQKKIIFLTQKWHQKFEKEENSKLIGFSDNYNSLKKGGVIFPPENYNIQTYNNYISEDESKNSLMKANAIKKLTKESEEIKKSMGINFANPFSQMDISDNLNNNNMCLDDEENENQNQNENNQKKEQQNLDDENPYVQKEEKESNSKNIFSNDNNINDADKNNNKFNNFDNNNISENNNNNISDNNNKSKYTNNGEENNVSNNIQNFSQEKEQESKYPNFPSQMSNLVNNNINNNNQNNNAYKFRNNPMNNQNNQFSNVNKNYNNINQNYNNNNNNNHNYYNNFSNNNNNFQNNNNYNNNYNNQGQNDYLLEAKTYKRLLGKKLLQLNAWINEGKYSFNSGKLKQGIEEILNEISNCNNMMRNYQNKGQRQAFETIRNMRLDIEQTCYRYESLMNDQNVEPFFSSFSGNTRQYYYDTNRMFGIQQNYEMGNFDNYYKSSGLATGNNYGNNNYNYKREETFGDKLSSFGNTVKDGLISFGKSVKNTAVSGYEFVKKKIDKDD